MRESNQLQQIVQINTSDDGPSFTYYEWSGDGMEELARIEYLETRIGIGGIDALCHDAICGMLCGNWDGEWRSLERGATFVVDINHPYLSRRQMRHAFNKWIAPILGRPPQLRGFPLFWQLFGFALAKKTRDQVFEPAYQDLLAQYLRSRQFSGKWARRWLILCFTWRTIGLVVTCFKVASVSIIAAAFWRVMPNGWKEWLLRLFW